MSIGSPPVAVPAATLLLVRDGADGLEVMMVARHHAAGFAAGALVFPGGKVDALDPSHAGRCRGAAGLDERAAAGRICAIRETWEECGLLLARRAGARALLSHAELLALRQARGAELGALLGEPGLELADDLMVPFAHWITPADRPRRFDTLFFIAPFDGDQMPLHDGREAVDARWVRPGEAIAAADAGRLKLVFATRMNLLKLTRCATAAKAVAAAREGKVVTVIPEVAATERGPVFRIPSDAGYGVVEVPVAGIGRA